MQERYSHLPPHLSTHEVMHGLTLCIEGSWDEVTRIIGQAHQLLHEQGVVRIQSDIRIGSRTDKIQSAEDKVKAVERLLANDK